MFFIGTAQNRSQFIINLCSWLFLLVGAEEQAMTREDINVSPTRKLKLYNNRRAKSYEGHSVHCWSDTLIQLCGDLAYEFGQEQYKNTV